MSVNAMKMKTSERIVFILRHNKKRMWCSEIAKQLDISESTAYQCLNRLAKKGIVKKFNADRTNVTYVLDPYWDNGRTF